MMAFSRRGCPVHERRSYGTTAREPTTAEFRNGNLYVVDGISSLYDHHRLSTAIVAVAVTQSGVIGDDGRSRAARRVEVGWTPESTACT